MRTRRVLDPLLAVLVAAALISGAVVSSTSASADNTPTPTPTPSPVVDSGLTLDTPSPGPTSVTATATPSTPTARPTDMRVFAIGDSVMLGARPCLERLGYQVDALGSRRPDAVAMELTSRRAHLPWRIVVHTGTNGGATEDDLTRIVRAIGPGHQIVLVTVQLPDHTKYTFENRTNDAIAAIAQRYPFVRVADWHAWSDAHAGLTYADGIHLPPAGCRAFSWVVSSSVRDIVAALTSSPTAGPFPGPR